MRGCESEGQLGSFPQAVIFQRPVIECLTSSVSIRANSEMNCCAVVVLITSRTVFHPT